MSRVPQEVKIFSATTHVERNQLGDRVTRWLAAERSIGLLDLEVLQSSDATHHCVTIVVTYRRGG